MKFTNITRSLSPVLVLVLVLLVVLVLCTSTSAAMGDYCETNCITSTRTSFSTS
jgi:hypothetical protein